MAVNSDTQLQGLVDLARNGDKRAKTLLLDHACDRLLRLTRKMVRTYPVLRRWETTDDVFQNSLIRLHRSLAEVELSSVRHFFNLAALQIRRELLDLVRRHLGPEGIGSNHHTDYQSADDAGGSLSRTLEEPEDLTSWTAFHEKVGTLSDEHREVVSLLYYEGVTQEEAASLLGIGLRTLKRRWLEAKIKLQEALRDGPG